MSAERVGAPGGCETGGRTEWARPSNSPPPPGLRFMRNEGMIFKLASHLYRACTAACCMLLGGSFDCVIRHHARTGAAAGAGAWTRHRAATLAIFGTGLCRTIRR
jgi:hypothetical protein